MEEGWSELVAHGVPDGPIRPAGGRRFDRAAVRRALAGLDLERLEERQRETLYAWLRGFRHHWGEGFERELGAEGVRVLERLEAGPPVDPDRYLKLRRIAIENLSRLI